MPLLDEIAALQVAKIRCEIEKLQAETRLLPRFCWLQASYIGATLPIIAVFITGWITYSNSDWRRNAEKLQEQVATLRPEADKLRMQVTGLQKQADSLRSERARLAEEVRLLEARAMGLQNQIRMYNASILKWRTQLLNIDTRLKGKSFGGGGIQIFPPPNAEPERKLLQAIIDSMLATLGSTPPAR